MLVDLLAAVALVVLIPLGVRGLAPRLRARWAAWQAKHSEAGRAAKSAEVRTKLAADLRRLEGEYRRVFESNLPAKAARLRALNLAYDETLRCCCAEVGLPRPETIPLSGYDRLETEAALVQAGLVW
ncbi:MAG: hypothetical protein JO147_14880 [Actinobacteria bacterium]|nr:hypothetical protein [Actinomycetota bacterium]